ncbi:Uncharacterised protein [Klebsiella aerogenes]|nr:Uncharacterised protein [Klebsiella aerogenes]
MLNKGRRIIYSIKRFFIKIKRRLPKAVYAYEPVCLRVLQSIAAFRRFASRQHAHALSRWPSLFHASSRFVRNTVIEISYKDLLIVAS